MGKFGPEWTDDQSASDWLEKKIIQKSWAPQNYWALSPVLPGLCVNPAMVPDSNILATLMVRLLV